MVELLDYYDDSETEWFSFLNEKDERCTIEVHLKNGNIKDTRLLDFYNGMEGEEFLAEFTKAINDLEDSELDFYFRTDSWSDGQGTAKISGFRAPTLDEIRIVDELRKQVPDLDAKAEERAVKIEDIRKQMQELDKQLRKLQG